MMKLKLEGIALDVYLGVYGFEQVMRQKVLVDLEIVFRVPPKGCESDQLEDTLCYAKINEVLIQVSLAKRYQLIEHLAKSLVDSLVVHLMDSVDICLTLHKKPPLDNVKNTSFYVEYLCRK